MKKLFTITLIVCLITSMLGGCGATNSKASESTPAIKLTEVDISQFPDAREYDVYYWPTSGIASEIPVPAWSNRGWIDYNEADHFRCYVGYTTMEDANNYINELQVFGFTVNGFCDGDWRFYAETEDGKGILLCYWEEGSYISLEVARDCSVIDSTILGSTT